MKKSMCCNADMIYLGKNNIHVPITQVIGNTYNYCCSKCGNCEWSTAKEKCKYKWYKFDKEKLRKLIDTGINVGDQGDEINEKRNS